MDLLPCPGRPIEHILQTADPPSQAELPIELPGQTGSLIQLCRWAELLAGISAWLQAGMQFAKF